MKAAIILIVCLGSSLGLQASAFSGESILILQSKCRIGDSVNYKIDGGVAKYAKEAIEGDLGAAQAIVSYLRPISEHAKVGSSIGCRLKVWQEVAAANGDMQSTYELAFGADKRDWYSCGRAKYWARSFVRNFRDNSKSNQLSIDTKFKLAQMAKVIAAECPNLK